MRKGELKTAVLGLDENGQLLLKAASQIDYFQIEAVADTDSNTAEKIATEYKCSAYDDYRQLVIGMDCRPFGYRSGQALRSDEIRTLLVTAGLHNCAEYIRAAMKKKFNVLKLAPAGRDFEEAAEFVQLAEDEGVKFAIANPSRFARSFLAFRQFLEKDEIEQVFLVTAFCNVGDQQQPAWQSDPKLGGGGVILYNCYHLIDQILWNFPMPQQVYSLNTNRASDQQQRSYLTEDTAVVTMKFDDTLTGNLIAFRHSGLGPKQDFLKLYGKEKILTVSSNQFTISNGLEQSGKQLQYDDDPLSCLIKLLENFALNILSPDDNKLCSSGRENLKNMAVIESAYLSARTGIPEEPGRILGLRFNQITKPTGS
jgi:predicted dehydrogenase